MDKTTIALDAMKRLSDQMAKDSEERRKKFNEENPPVFEKEISFSGELYTCGFWKIGGEYYWAIKRNRGYNEYELQYIPKGLLEGLIELKGKN